jgi:glucoamylase
MKPRLRAAGAEFNADGQRVLTASADRAAQLWNASLGAGFHQISEEYAEGWDQYLNSLHDAPPSLFTKHQRQLYAVSAMVLAASEDKTFRGGFVASPTMPWAWGTGLINPSGPYRKGPANKPASV